MRSGGIWRLLAPERAPRYERFIHEYDVVRQGEGRGCEDPAYYRGLPFHDATGRHSADWRIRARSFETFVRRVLVPLEQDRRPPLSALDLGAGSGWLAARLAARGHHVGAVDLRDDAMDGLGALPRYEPRVVPIQAEFDRLPFEDGQIDLAVFNASFHYAERFEATLAEALRVLRVRGRVVLLDTPIYRRAASGARMVEERHAHFERAYGTRSDALDSENFLTYRRLEQLGTAFGLAWVRTRPFYGLRWALRPWKARLLGRREPAQFMIVVGEKVS